MEEERKIRFGFNLSCKFPFRKGARGQKLIIIIRGIITTTAEMTMIIIATELTIISQWGGKNDRSTTSQRFLSNLKLLQNSNRLYIICIHCQILLLVSARNRCSNPSYTLKES